MCGPRALSLATWVVACWVWIDVYLLYNTLTVAMDLVSHQCAWRSWSLLALAREFAGKRVGPDITSTCSLQQSTLVIPSTFRVLTGSDQIHALERVSSPITRSCGYPTATYCLR